MTEEQLAVFAAEQAAEKKSRDILVLDLQGLSQVTDYFVICTGNSSTQVKAISDFIDEKLGEKNVQLLRREGYREGRWILMDYGDLVIHIFQEEARQFYNLERLWGDAREVARLDGSLTLNI